MRGIEQELAELRDELERSETIRQDLAANQGIDPRRLVDGMSKLERMINENVYKIIDDGESQYIRALIDPFNA